MTFHVLFVSLLELGVGVVCLGIGGLAWRHRAQPAGTPLVGLAVAAAGWAVASAVASIVVDPVVTLWAQYVAYAFVGFAAVTWFYVAVEFTDRAWWKRRPVVLGVLAALGLQWIVIATDPSHHLYLSATSRVSATGLIDPTPGPLLWLNAAWEIGLVLAGIGFVIQTYGDRRGVIRVQSVAIIVAGLLPVATGLIELYDVVSVPGLDVGVIGTGSSAGIVLWALFYAAFLDVVPVARETLLENLPDPVVALDSSGRVVDLNDAAMALFDVDEAAVGTPASTVFDDRVTLAPDDLEAREVPVPVTVEVDGVKRHFELDASPISPPGPTWRPTRAGDGLGSVLVFRDVTQLTERERELREKNARLEEFTSIVSHDLLNPLHVVRGRWELARETGDEEHLDEMEGALDRMQTLVEDLLFLARDGATVSNKDPVSLEEVARAAWTTVDADGATLVVADDLTVMADRSRLRSAIENLLRNAVEHGGDDVVITVGPLDDGVGFFVADDGAGVPEADRDAVFELGYSEDDDGTGLGLAIVREVARAHGWEVHLTAADGGGARFEFTVDPAGA